MGGLSRPTVAVVGGGVIGLSAAWALAARGVRVDLYDDAPGRGASHAAAGMLAPVSEVSFGEVDLLRLGLASLALWPAFAARLEEATSAQIELRREGSLVAGLDRDDAVELDRTAALMTEHGLAVRTLSGRQARRVEPALAPRLHAALDVPGDHSVDNRRLLAALRTAAERAGVRVHQHRVAVVERDGRVRGVQPIRGSGTVPPPASWSPSDSGAMADLVVLAAGAASPSVPGLPAEARPHVRPVKGQILRLHGAPGLLSRTIRATAHGDTVYLVPRSTGELVVGATTEDVGCDPRVTAGGVHTLLRAAIAVVPEIADLELRETLTRFRPGTPDNGPIIGHAVAPGLVHATGHGRGGVLLAPITAMAVTALVLGEQVPPVVDLFSPQRFSAPRPTVDQSARSSTLPDSEVRP